MLSFAVATHASKFCLFLKFGYASKFTDLNRCACFMYH